MYNPYKILSILTVLALCASAQDINVRITSLDSPLLGKPPLRLPRPRRRSLPLPPENPPKVFAYLESAPPSPN